MTANPIVELVDEESWNTLQEVQPSLAVAVRTLVLAGEKPGNIAATMRRKGGTPFLVNLVKSAAAYLARRSD